MTERNIARLVLGGVSSGVGKTTTTVGLARALRARGLRVACFKCGPDYLDPTYLVRASGRPCANLDGWMMGREGVLAAFARGSADADVALIEGVMGLFDGASPTGDAGSTAEIAKWLQSPVALVVDAGGMARSVAAVGHGFATFDPDVRVAGLICNRIGGPGHLELLRKATASPPIFGGFPKAAESEQFAGRHLGLVTASRGAVSDALIDAWGARAEEHLRVSALVSLAQSAPPLDMPPTPPPAEAAGRCAIGIASDEAFHFYYDENLARLEAAGARLVRFSPMRDAALPEVDGLYFGGGYPEVHAEALSANRAMREAVVAHAARGRPVYAECGGMIYLAEAIRRMDGTRWPMAGILPGEVTMHPRLQALGYVEVETQAASILGPAGTRFRGHQFRYSEYVPGSGLDAPLYAVRRRRTDDVAREGYAKARVVASYVHAHWASNSEVPKAFVRACEDVRSRA